MDLQVWDLNFKRALAHLSFALELAEMQVLGGRHFLFEQPLTATSWDQKVMLDFLNRHPDLYLSTCDQCCFDLKLKDIDGEVCRSKKPTRFLTSSGRLAGELEQKCQCTGPHC